MLSLPLLHALRVGVLPGESLELNTKSSSSDPSLDFVLSCSADSVASVAAEILELSNDKQSLVRILYSFWLAMQSTPYKLVRFLMTLALRYVVPLATFFMATFMSLIRDRSMRDSVMVAKRGLQVMEKGHLLA